MVYRLKVRVYTVIAIRVHTRVLIESPSVHHRLLNPGVEHETLLDRHRIYHVPSEMPQETQMLKKSDNIDLMLKHVTAMVKYLIFRRLPTTE